MIRADIIITGNVQMVGFRTFLKNLADSLHITGYAKNLEDGSVNVVCEGEGENIEEMIGKIRENSPSFASVGDISTEYSDYGAEFTSFERTDGDVPKEATLGDLLGVMKSFDTKAETLVGILSGMDSTLKGVKEDTSLMLDKQDQMLDKQDQMLDKQDQMLDKQDQMLDKQDSMLEKQDSMLEKQDSMLEKQNVHTQILTGFRDQTNQNFEVLNVKYGRISEKMDGILDEMREERRELRTSMEGLTDAIIKVAESKK